MALRKKSSSGSDDAGGTNGNNNPYELLGAYDVICGRDTHSFRNPGNRRFRVTVSLLLKQYKDTPKRREKSTIVRKAIETVKSCGGRFLNLKDGVWEELSPKRTQEKVGHCFRDMSQKSKGKEEDNEALAANTKRVRKMLSQKTAATDARTAVDRLQKEPSNDEDSCTSNSSKTSNLDRLHGPLLSLAAAASNLWSAGEDSAGGKAPEDNTSLIATKNETASTSTRCAATPDESPVPTKKMKTIYKDSADVSVEEDALYSKEDMNRAINSVLGEVISFK